MLLLVSDVRTAAVMKMNKPCLSLPKGPIVRFQGLIFLRFCGIGVNCATSHVLVSTRRPKAGASCVAFGPDADAGQAF
jgi:hypothetical protein